MTELINLLILIVVFGVVLWLINVYIPMAAVVKSLLNLVVLIVLVIYILQFFGVINPPLLPMVRFLK